MEEVYPFPLTELITCGEYGKHLGGKGGTSRSQKHFYYGHALLKDPTLKVSEISCQVKNVRAPRLEEIVMKCLKSVLADPELIGKWIKIYREQTLSKQPGLLSDTKRLDAEISQIARKTTNLIQRVADLPPDLPAEGFYDQIRQLTQKKDQLSIEREKLGSELRDLNAADIDEAELFEKIRNAVGRLERLPVDKQRTVFKDLIHNIEVYPMKLKIELFTPTKGSLRNENQDPQTQKATGTDGLALNLKKSDAKIILLNSNRDGSNTLTFGARDWT